MVKFEDITKIMKKANIAGPASEEMIKAAEDELGVRFPPSYRYFLKSYGAALCTGFEIGGLFTSSGDDEPPLWTDVVTAALRKRRISRGSIPNEYIPISDEGGDYTFYLDTTQRRSDGECPVVVLGPGADDVVVAESFFDFVTRTFERGISF
jgi:cell wall assembly regulator SMI1